MRVYGMSLSGNCYKLKLLMELAGQTYQWEEVDILAGETAVPEFLAKNANGKVPVLELDNGEFLPESNAGLFYLAAGSDFYPNDTLTQARVLQWMFFEQYSHEPAIAVARFISKFLPEDHPRRADLPALHDKGYQAFKVMEQHLSTEQWFAGEQASIADIALYAYSHVATDGGFDLTDYPHVLRWFEDIQGLPGYVPMTER